ncbi:MAG TPA: ATP-binding protein [Pyrinomonadaceae bacterium]|nr:ATP-binding protein [Pyrinomonadaceae bacterium]
MIQPRILGRINRDEFFGRDAELRLIGRHAVALDDTRVLVAAAEPGAGASELLRQAYDQLFARRGDPVPIYFAFRAGETAAQLAPRIFQTFLQQYVAYRRVEPSVCQARLTLRDVLELALPGDYEFIAGLFQLFQREESSTENLRTFCLNLPQRFAAARRPVFPLIDCLNLQPLSRELTLAHDFVSAFESSSAPLLIAVLRRQATELIHGFENGDRRAHTIMHVDRIDDDSARNVADAVARRYGIQADEATRDLIVQQLHASPSLISEFLRTAHEKQLPLAGFVDCQRLYVDELLGGSIKRYFDRVLELAGVGPQSRSMLFRLLSESATSASRQASPWAWKQRLDFGASEIERLIGVLHVRELVNSSGALVEVNPNWQTWLDYLNAQYQVEVAHEPRAQIVASTLLHMLKRSSQTMARKYRREVALGIDEVIAGFDCQKVPASLFHYDKFSARYRGEDDEAIGRGLDNEAELFELPQVVQTAACAAYSGNLSCETERCVVAHGFESGEYADANERVWICAQIDSKLEASRELTADWCDRLSAFARQNLFKHVRIWLIAPAGFSAGACELLNERGALGSSHQQFEILKSRLAPQETDDTLADEFQMVLPMSADTELIAARTAEQIARRVNFRPEAINQIKTAVVEACINAAEHSLSPDRRIYQRFVVEDDKLVITVASRGVVPVLVAGNGETSDKGNGTSRRGWGLTLIKSLMDEVEFERVDDGTRLKMTKYFGKS